MQIAAEDAWKALPFAPYVMFIIERVTGYIFTKDGLHEPYRGEKTHHHVAVGETVPQSSAAVADRPESSRSSSHRKKKSKIARFLRAIFGMCSYAA